MSDKTPPSEPAAPEPSGEPGGTAPGSPPAGGQPPGDGKETGRPSEPGSGQRGDQGAGSGDGDGKGNSEAARYRTQLRTVEAERDALAERVTGYQRKHVERLAGDRLADPADLWSSTELADLLDDGAEVDDAKVTAAVEELVKAKPHYGKRGATPKPDLSQGGRGGAGATEPRIGAIFSQS